MSASRHRLRLVNTATDVDISDGFSIAFWHTSHPSVIARNAKNMILMITSTYDLTCDYLIKKYIHSEFYRLNLDKFSSYQIQIDNNGFTIENIFGKITTKTCKAIYFRKPILEKLDGIFEDCYHNFSHKETYSLIEGLAESFEGICLSRPSVMRRANNKILQLFLAKKIGFITPKSNICNSITAWHKTRNTIIIKPLASGIIEHSQHKEFIQTNIYDKNIDNKLLKHTPSYFQEYVEKSYEVRATFTGTKAFSVKIISENKIDWRKNNNKLTYEEHTLPSEIYEKCIQFMKELQINFGCFDFIIKDDVYYFLEMNANGQWAWLEF